MLILNDGILDQTCTSTHWRSLDLNWGSALFSAFLVRSEVVFLFVLLVQSEVVFLFVLLVQSEVVFLFMLLVQSEVVFLFMLLVPF